MKQFLGLAGLALALALVACGETEAFRPERVRGTIAFYDEPVQIIVPDSVRRGETFTLTVITFIGGCLEPGTTELEVAGLEATLSPYDLDFTRPNVPCTTGLAFHNHTAEVRFDKAGQARIQVIGLQEDVQHPKGVVITEMRTLEVR